MRMTGTSKRICSIIAAASVCIALAGCDSESSNSTSAQPIAPRNVLIVLMDATVATHMYPWHYSRDPAPNFRKIARNGMLFLNAHSQGANTTPSVWSFMTGNYPYIPQPIESYTTHRPFETDYMMAEAFRVAGFRTGGFSENPWIHTKYGWAKGFDFFKDVNALYDHEGARWTREPGATERTLKFAREWIEAQGEDRWFCYVHLIRPHDPYDAPERYTARYTRERLRDHNHPRAEHRLRETVNSGLGTIGGDDLQYLVDMYDANLRYVDELVGEFYRELGRSGVLDDTLIVLMSDHGEAFLEHGKLGHNTTVYEEMVHVPLAIVAPRGSGFAKGVFTGVVELVDLMPTFAELYGLAPPSPYTGTSLGPILRGTAGSVRTESISHSAFDHFRFSLRQGDLKLIATVDPAFREILSFELYDLSRDPGEQHDLANDASLAAPLLESAKAYLARAERKDTSGDPVLDPEDRERMEALGYGKSD